MIVDREALANLEIFRCRAGGQPLSRTIDRCRTAGGRRHLEHLITRGPAGGTGPRDLQAMTRFFHDAAPQLRFPLDDHAARQLEQYLESNFTSIDLSLSWNRHLQSWLDRWRYPEMYRFCAAGVSETLRSLQQGRDFVGAIAGHAACPPPLRALADEFLAGHRTADLDKLAARCTDPSVVEVFTADHLLRHQNRDRVQRMLAILHQLDAHVGMAIATREHGFAFPTFIDSAAPRLEIDGLAHPFLAAPVRNDLRLDPATNLLFLTGPNMAGKSTFMKAVGIAAILAHIGMGVPAVAMTLTPFDHLFCELGAQDDLRLGISSFMAEVNRIQRILQDCDERLRLLVIIDEIFKGTNVVDDFECSKLVIDGLATLREHLFLVSSHLVELADEIGHHPNLRCQNFDATVRDDRLEFSYQLKDGVSKTRLGVRLLAERGIIEWFRRRAANPLG